MTRPLTVYISSKIISTTTLSNDTTTDKIHGKPPRHQDPQVLQDANKIHQRHSRRLANGRRLTFRAPQDRHHVLQDQDSTSARQPTTFDNNSNDTTFSSQQPDPRTARLTARLLNYNAPQRQRLRETTLKHSTFRLHSPSRLHLTSWLHSPSRLHSNSRRCSPSRLHSRRSANGRCVNV